MRHCFAVLFSLIFIASPGLAKPLLQQGNLDNWSAYKIKGESLYEPIMDMEQGVVIRASSTNSASGYRYFHHIDLLSSPILQWQWTAQQLPFFMEMNDQGIEKTITEFDETQDSGDDFVLRIVVGRQALFGDAKTLSYVWSGNQSIGSHWAPNRHSRVLVVSGETQVKMQWQTLARNVQKDWLDLFGEKIDNLDFIGFITDSDAIKGEAIGYYGGISVLPEAVLSAQALQ
ncbi:MAG: DUF3047 domain-containing protein [Bermanella sp.]